MEDFNSILEKVEPWSLFEINRLRSAFDILLNDPIRIDGIKYKLKIGMQITYFCNETNSLIEATINEIKKTRASITHIHDGGKWSIPFYLINLQGIDTRITPKKLSNGLDRNSLAVGDLVGWNSKLGDECYGVITKLNPKKALVKIESGQQWRIPYSLLFSVMNGVTIQGVSLCIEGEVL